MTLEKQIVRIIIDDRESRSGLIDEIENYEYENTTTHVTTHVETTRLEVGDIICSDRVIIERKEVSDFVSSVISGHLASQVADMATSDYKRPMVILEGDTVFGLRGVSDEALRGMMAAVEVGWGIPIHSTKNIAETAAMVVTIARREQFQMKRSISIHGKRSHMTLPQKQEYVVSSIGGGVGPTTARTLLGHFHSVKAVIDADIDELVMVEGIGKKTAENIHEIIRSNYKS